jgi:hypothetical protein
MTLARKLLAAAPAAAGTFEFWDPSSAGGGWTWDHAYDAAGPNMSAVYSDTDPVTGDWLAEVGTLDLTRSGGGTLTYQATGLGGRPAIDFDGTGYFDGDAGAAISQPHSIVSVIDRDSGAPAYITDGSTAINQHVTGADSGGFWRVSCDVNLRGATADTDLHLMVTVGNGASSLIRVDGTTQSTGDAGSDGLRPLAVGARYDGADRWNGRIAAIGIYEGIITAASGFATWEAACITHYGI